MRRSAAILASCEGRNACPPNPGLTVITSTMSASSSSQATASTGVAGFSTTPARLPSARMACSERCGCGPASGCRHDVVGAGLGEGGEVGIGRADHQVHVERQARVRAQRLQHQRAEAEVGDEMAVHDVQVQPVGAGGLDRLDLVAQAGEVGGQQAGGDGQATVWCRRHGRGPGDGAPRAGRRAGGVGGNRRRDVGGYSPPWAAGREGSPRVLRSVAFAPNAPRGQANRSRMTRRINPWYH